MITITLEHLRGLWNAEFTDEGVLALTNSDGEDPAVRVWTQSTAESQDAEIILTATALHEHMQGEWDEYGDNIAAVLAHELTENLRNPGGQWT